jgi:hypothetical protein
MTSQSDAERDKAVVNAHHFPEAGDQIGKVIVTL